MNINKILKRIEGFESDKIFHRGCGIQTEVRTIKLNKTLVKKLLKEVGAYRTWCSSGANEIKGTFYYILRGEEIIRIPGNGREAWNYDGGGEEEYRGKMVGDYYINGDIVIMKEIDWAEHRSSASENWQEITIFLP